MKKFCFRLKKSCEKNPNVFNFVDTYHKHITPYESDWTRSHLRAAVASADAARTHPPHHPETRLHGH